MIMTLGKKGKKKKQDKAIRKAIRPSKLVDPEYRKVQPRKKGETWTPGQLKELKKLAKAHDEEIGYDMVGKPIRVDPELIAKGLVASKKKKSEFEAMLEKRRKKVKEARFEKKIPDMVEVTYMKDGEPVTELAVKGSPKLKELAAIKRAKLKALTQEEMLKIQRTRVSQYQDIMDVARLYQDQLKAQRFMATAFKGKVRPFPRRGYPVSRIITAYSKRKPKWRLKIRRDRRQEMVHMKIAGPREKLAGRDAVKREAVKILGFMNMTMHPSAVIEDNRKPQVYGKNAYIDIRVRANKIGEGEIRMPRRK